MKELNFDHDYETDFDKWLMSDEGNPGPYWHTCDDDPEPDDPEPDDGEYMEFLDSMLDEEES